MRKSLPKETSLVEIAWEVCNQVGGIYTVIRTKVPYMQDVWGENGVLVGPWFPERALAEFESIEHEDSDAFRAVTQLRQNGIEVHYGYWLISGKPKVVLLNPFSVYHKLGEIKYFLWENHQIECGDDDLINQVIAFGYLAKEFISEYTRIRLDKGEVIAHFHEWMSGVAIPQIRHENIPVKLMFTTHATMLGRYLAMNDAEFYEHLAFYDWQKESKYFNIETQAKIERAATHGAHLMSTVSDMTGQECRYLLGREPDSLLPNGLNIKRFTALHEFQNLHLEYKNKLHQFVMGHFFQSYSFDLNKTIYMFSSGRFEFRNKGFDITLEALARLNWRLKQMNSDVTVVFFLVSKQPYHSINPIVLQNRGIMEELRETCETIEKQVGNKLFYAAASNNDDKLPDLNNFVEEYWRMRYRRTVQSWKTDQLPTVVTHNLVNDEHDEVLNFLRTADLLNREEDKVKIVYHPDFINSTNPLFHMDYDQFVRGCHLGLFPSYYEPWGYTPLECMARGVPAITSDTSGFGDYTINHYKNLDKKGVYVVNRTEKSYNESADQLTDYMYSFIQQDRRQRISQRNKVEHASVGYDWGYLYKHYIDAYEKLMDSTI